ncbi:hypothetical protein [Micromonospora sp. WMMD980]|uniref:hypothetical protein n=1 Tax=Micromonospora sp. WMMD980 TaxID=3016088 RepID=UPI0024168D80|nr:hypothetical protein [Micromonospora sp. WMMD980]MDG4803194.1 hypothetical protein [Micromonospora sp. WMMD980]
MMLPRARSFSIIQSRHLNDHQKAALSYVPDGTGVATPQPAIRSSRYLANALRAIEAYDGLTVAATRRREVCGGSTNDDQPQLVNAALCAASVSLIEHNTADMPAVRKRHEPRWESDSLSRFCLNGAHPKVDAVQGCVILSDTKDPPA